MAKSKGGRPLKKLDEDQIAQVESLASFLSTSQIADYLGISRTTFYEILDRQPEVSGRYYKGRSKAITNVAQSVINSALDGNMTAAIFYLKTQAGWREKEAEQNDDAQSMSISFEVNSAASDVKVTHGKA